MCIREPIQKLTITLVIKFQNNNHKCYSMFHKKIQKLSTPCDKPYDKPCMTECIKNNIPAKSKGYPHEALRLDTRYDIHDMTSLEAARMRVNMYTQI